MNSKENDNDGVCLGDRCECVDVCVWCCSCGADKDSANGDGVETNVCGVMSTQGDGCVCKIVESVCRCVEVVRGAERDNDNGDGMKTVENSYSNEDNVSDYDDDGDDGGGRSDSKGDSDMSGVSGAN
jgi:hypothetical protein